MSDGRFLSIYTPVWWPSHHRSLRPKEILLANVIARGTTEDNFIGKTLELLYFCCKV